MVRQADLSFLEDAQTPNTLYDRAAYIWHDSVYVETFLYVSGIFFLTLLAIVLLYKIYGMVTTNGTLSRYLCS